MANQRVSAQLRKWRDELIDLSRRNRLLHCTANRSSALEIRAPDARSVLSRLRDGSGWRFHYPPHELVEDDEAVRVALEAEDPDLTEELRPDELLTNVESARDLSRILHTLERRASSEYIDKGLRVLYIGVGMLEWADSNSENLSSPMVLVPVALERPNPRSPFRLVGTDEDLVANPALAAKLEREFDISLPELSLDDFDLDSYRDAFGAALRERAAIWRVTPRVVLSCFSFHKEAMYRDLEANEEQICEHPIVRTIALGTQGEHDLGFDVIPDEQLDDKAPPEQLASILDADATQRQCIAAARAGHSFVMDGPPGTGKSQTIANIVAELLNAGRSVLFVSEKAAALDVVKTRLDKCGLGEFVLELHSHKATRKEVVKELAAALESRPSATSPLRETDVQRVAQRRKQLSDYAAALNEIRHPFGRSLFDALGRSAALEAFAGAPLPQGIGADLDASSYNALLDAAQSLSLAWGPVERRAEFLWRDLVDPSDAARRSNEIRVLLDELEDAVLAVQSYGDAAAYELELPAPTRQAETDRLLRVLQHLQERPDVPTFWLTVDDFTALQERLVALERRATRRSELRASLAQVANNWESLDPRSADLLAAAQGRLCALDPPIALSPQLKTSELRAQLEFERATALHLETWSAHGARLAALLGAHLDENSSLEDVLRIAELGALGGADHLPDATWLDGAVSAARTAAAVLRPLVDEYRRLAGLLGEVYNDELQRLDLESFYASEHDTSPQLSRFSGIGRRNRRNLKACTRSGKLKKSAIALLPIARSWQRLRQQLDAAEAEHASALGAYYSRRDEADFDRVESALGVAERALALLGSAGDRRRLSENLALQSPEARELGASARELLASLSQVIDEGSRLLGEPFMTRSRGPVRELTDWLRDVAGGTARIVEVADGLGLDLEYANLRSIANDRSELHALENEWEAATSENAALVGGNFAGYDTDWQLVWSSLEWVERLCDLLGGPISDFTSQRLLTTLLRPDDLDRSLRDCVKRFDLLAAFFQSERAQILRADFEVSWDDGRLLIDDLRRTLGDIDEWKRFVEHCEWLRANGAADVLDYLVEKGVSRDAVVPAVERVVLSAWMNAIFDEDARLTPIHSLERNALIEDFRGLDRQLRHDAIARVVNECSARRPKTLAGAAGILKKEGEKKTRHMPIRELLARTSDVALACKPCFMMSPLSVSQYLPAGLTFDAVIFDEASQVRPSDAINAIYRGRQLIVAGDNRQLPPTSFFQHMTNDDDDTWEEEQIDEFESILDAVKGTGRVPSLPLRWHYRSRHESLITYSNYEFYEGRLVTYPGALQEGPDVGVEFIHVPDGVYARGGARDNVIEARRVVERVLWYAQNYPELTVGVVALSEAQASRIEFELTYARQERPDLDAWFTDDRLNGFFLKNLENVQGDERDVIILSIGYGRDEVGKLTMNFGPINQAGGGRRLNVAVTRARRRLEVVSSITANDIIETGSPGVRNLRRYLDYAARGIVAVAAELSEEGRDAESPFEEEVLRVVRSWGYDAVPQVGQAGYRIDIGIRDPRQPGRYALGIECDGAAYHSSKVARDRDRLRQEVLQDLGWNLYRIWGPAWYRSRLEEEARLQRAIEDAIAGKRLISRPGGVTGPNITVATADLNGPPEWTAPYVRSSLTKFPALAMDDPAARRTLEKAIIQIVEIEGPIVYALLAQRTRELWGAGRMGSKMRTAFDSAVEHLIQQKRLVRAAGEVLSTPGSTLSVVRRPSDDPATIREAKHVPKVEVELALSRLVSDARAIDPEELSSRTARLFGWNRRGVEVNAVIDAALQSLLARGDVMRDADGTLRPRD